MKPTRSVRIPSDLRVPIVGDAALAGPVADGRFIPVLILDTSNHPAIEEVIRVHEHLAPGDVEFNWGRRKKSRDEVFLMLNFERPVEAEALLLFSIEQQGSLVDLILHSKALWIQSGAPGDRLSTALDEQRLLLALPDTGFAEYWEGLYLKRMTEVIRRRAGIPRSQARDAAHELIVKLREAHSFRMSH